MSHYLFFLYITLFVSATAVAQDQQNWSAARPDGHAPISVMGDHTHHKGEVMFSYKYMPMWMKGSLQDSDAIAESAIFQNYMAAPQDMQMNMHMLGSMFAPSENVTLVAMVNYISNTMALKTKMGMGFTTQSKGFGDLTLAALVNMFKLPHQSIHAIAGVSIPTGDIDQRGNTPMMNNAQLAYPMQLGSGTLDPILGITYLGQKACYSWGVQTKNTFRIYANSEKYRLGNQFSMVGWGAIKASDYISFSGSLRYTNTQSIIGKDADLNPMLMPLFNTVNSGREQIDAGVGINFYIPKGVWKNLRLATELLLPVLQQVDGIQMKNTSMATFGIQYALHH